MNFMEYKTLEDAVIATAKEIREELDKLNVSRMDLSITIEGRVGDGDLEIKYGLGEWGADVKGGTLAPVVQEFLRRKGWNESHAPLCLPRVES
jgi:hypothetical protein